MGPPPRSLAADAYDCIMVQVRHGPTEYKRVARLIAPDGGLYSDRRVRTVATARAWNRRNGIRTQRLTAEAPYKLPTGCADPQGMKPVAA